MIEQITTTSPPAPVPRHQGHSGKPGLAVWAMALGAMALIAVAGLWLNDRAQTQTIKADLARKLAEMAATSKESQLLSRNADDTARKFSDRLTQAEAMLANTTEQRKALESLYQEFSRDRDLSLLADMEQSLLAASQQLQLNSNLKGAIIALETADQRIAQLNKPQFALVRQAISRDLGRLRAVPAVDYEGMSYKLSTMAESSTQWPLSSAYSHPAGKPARPQSFGTGLLEELGKLVQIRRIDQNEPALLAPSQDYFLHQNLKLRLLSARFSLLSRDMPGYRADLLAVGNLLSRYFNVSEAAVSSAATEIRKLAAINIAPALPAIESLSAIQSLQRRNQS